MPVIQCKGLQKTYSIGLLQKSCKKALTDFSLSIEQGEVFGIIGPNGAGKSTFLKILMGFIRPDRGEVMLAHGNDPKKPIAKQQVGYLPETPTLYSQLTILDHLNFAAKISGKTKTWTKGRIQQVLQTVQLEDAATLSIHRFSKGMTQRAALANAIFLEPEILILDEPMSGLDPLGRKLIIDIIKNYSTTTTTVLFCSHILSDVERICTRIGVMKNGKLLTITTPEELSQYQPQTSGSSGSSPLETFFLDSIRQ